MAPKVGVLLFPGSNCEQDVVEAFAGLGADADLIWHGDRSLGGADAVVVPGGFAHGDYLRPGAIARFSRSWRRWPSSPLRAGRSSASATASRCFVRRDCCPASCRRTPACASSVRR